MDTNDRNEPSSLTRRELEVLRLAQEGKSNNEIATELGISRNAVRYHLKELHSKLGTDGARETLANRWRRALAIFGLPASKLGVPVTTALFAGGIALTGAATIRYAPHRDASAPTEQVSNCPSEYFAGTMTMRDFAFGNVTIGELRRLNPDVPDGPLPPDTILRVPNDPSRECGEAVMTPAGSIPQSGGTPTTNSGKSNVGEVAPSHVR